MYEVDILEGRTSSLHCCCVSGLERAACVSAGEGQLGEAGVREAGRVEAVGHASRRGAADDPRGREVATDVGVPVADLVQSGAGGHL